MKSFPVRVVVFLFCLGQTFVGMGQSFPFQTNPLGGYSNAPHIFQEPSTNIQKVGMHYTSCELKMPASSKLGAITFASSSTLGLNAGAIVNVYLDNSDYCDLRSWRSWTQVNDSADAIGQAQLVIVNATNFRLVFSAALANIFIYHGGGLDVFVEGLGLVSTATLSGFESAGNIGFWGNNMPILSSNVIRPVMGGNYSLTTQNVPPTCLRTLTCSAQTQYCPGEAICMYLKKQDGVFANDGALTFSWETTTTPCDAATWITIPASNSASLQLTAPTLSGTYYYRCKITDGASLYYSSLSGTCSAVGCNDYFSVTVIPALNTLGCYNEPDLESISLGARISEVEMKVNGALLLKSNTNFLNGVCTPGADFYAVYARPNVGFALNPIVEAPIVSPSISWMDFSDALASTVVPEVHPGDLIDFKVRMSNCDKPQLFNHAVRLEFDWDNNQTFETIYNFNFLEATPVLSYYQDLPESPFLNPSDADSVVYLKSFTVPCDIVCGNNVVTKFRVSLKRLPTGWGDAEDYAIKSLCNDISITYSGSDTICQGQSKLLSVGVGSTFQWNKDGLPIAGATSNSFSASQSGAYSVTVQVAGCTYTSAVVDIVVEIVNVDAGLDVSICLGDAVTLSGSGANSYSWNNGITNGVSFSPSVSANYVVTGTSLYGCQNSDTVYVDVLVPTQYFLDADGDGYGSSVILTCINPGAGYVLVGGDCNDSQSNIFPFNLESCNAIDDNCNGVIDEGCTLGLALSSAQITSTPQYGMPGTNFSHVTNMATMSDYPESNSGVYEKWFKFQALSNAIRIEVIGASTSDDNSIRLFSDPGLSYTTPLVPIVEENDVNFSSIGAIDQGNEILLSDLLIEGQWYYACITTMGGSPGIITTKFNALLPSTCDVMPFTSYTGVYTNNCQTFKCQYRTQARRAIIHRWSSGVQTGSPLSSYTIPAPTTLITTCQLAKITPVNMTGAAQTIFISADLEYNLLDAAGNFNILFARQISNCSFQLNSESSSNVRSTDECPIYKSYASSVATDRSICGAMQYQWEFSMVYPSPGLPVSVNGASNSRILALSSVPGMTNGQRYDVRIRSLYSDATTYSNWSLVSDCIRTIGAAGLTPLEVKEVSNFNNAHASVFPNPTLVHSSARLSWQYDNVNAVEVYNIHGQCVERHNLEMPFNKVMELQGNHAGGLYHIVLRTGQTMYCIPWVLE